MHYIEIEGERIRCRDQHQAAALASLWRTTLLYAPELRAVIAVKIRALLCQRAADR